MKIEDFNPLWYNVFARKQIPPRKDEVLMQKVVLVKSVLGEHTKHIQVARLNLTDRDKKKYLLVA